MAKSSIDHPHRRIPPPPQPVLRRHKPLPASPDPVLPVELVWEILTWLPVKSLMRFKCVSRTWRSIILDPSFAGAYRGGFRGLLVAQPSDERLTTEKDFFYITLDGDGPTAEISHHSTVDHDGRGGQRMGYTNIVDGLVCFYFRNYSCLYNIATRETLQLPLSSHDDLACSYHFGFDPVNKLYKLLKLCPIYEEYDDKYHFPEVEAVFLSYLKCEILTVGMDSSWRIIDSLPPMQIVSRSQCLGGVLYWMEPREEIIRCLIAFHLSEEKFHLIPTPTGGRDPLRLPNFGPGLALIYRHWCFGFCDSTIFHYQFGKGWAEQKIDFPAAKEYLLTPQGILPNGKVLISGRLPGYLSISTPIYLYDPAKRGFQEKVIHIPDPICSLLWKADNLYVVDDNSSYHQENIIPLSCLTSSCT